MKVSEKGFTLIELLISISIISATIAAAGAAIYQMMSNTQRNADHMTAVRQVENAGAWISRDAQMALSANGTEDLTLPDFLVLAWTTWDATGANPVYHSARYFFEGLTGGVGTLMRNHWSSDGANQTTLIAQYIYYDSSDITNTSNANYENPLLTVKLTGTSEDILESREYKIKRRPNY